MKLMAASAALAGGACSGPPQEVIVPYVRMPEGVVPGQPLFYATAFVRRGLAQGVLVESNLGRPTKVEGNPRHPASLGATDVFAQASVLELWDPERSQAVRQGAELSTWQAFEDALLARRTYWDSNGGAGLCFLTGRVGSPSLAAQMADVLARYPRARWHCHDPYDTGVAYEAEQLAFGKPLDMVYRFDQAAVVMTFDADVLGDWPGALRYARDVMQDRRSTAPRFERRWYAIEATPGVTGAIADNRLALSPPDIERLVWRIASRLGIAEVPSEVPGPAAPQAKKWETVLADRLRQHAGASVLVAGNSLSANTRALIHRINAMLGNFGKTVMPIAPVTSSSTTPADSLGALAQAMHEGAVTSLIMLDSNPVYDAPFELGFGEAVRKVPFSVHLGLYRDETARASAWHLPLAHGYEQWSDARAYDGTATIVQPVTAPLYGGRSAHELMAMLAGQAARAGHGIVRAFWRQRDGGAEFERFWEGALREGVVPHSASASVTVQAVSSVPPPSFEAPALCARFAADPSVGAGEFANNAWLQELPRPMTTLTWDNAALIGAATATALGVESGDVVSFSRPGRPDAAVDAPVLVSARHAEGVVTLPLGYGRTAAGSVGNNVGFNAFALKTSTGPHALRANRTGRHHTFAITQHHATMEGRRIIPIRSVDAFRRHTGFANDTPRERRPEVSLYPDWDYPGYKWGMAIDLNACIGCNACTIACQAENNIPVVGKAQVLRGREMHWIRVDHYEAATETDGAHARTAFQPVPCMHCETAPCEEVCPVGATVHDSEGLNLQVYNRCVGTRFCSNNCPYKVRRFNFLQFTGGGMDRPAPAYNPEVTVRRRGVMEKCTYCLQRITRARIAAEKEGRRLRDGEVVTACQAVCPTEAIVFGDLNDPHSRVRLAKASPLDYALLAEMNTRPRTSYAALLVNPDEALD